tara:strand:- start:3286 stop:3423 length:138 start_codon:yes stop_codon:yes gene_type:complete
MPQVGKKSFGYSSAGKKKAKAYAVKTGKPMKVVKKSTTKKMSSRY